MRHVTHWLETIDARVRQQSMFGGSFEKYSDSLNVVNSDAYISLFSDLLCNQAMKTIGVLRRENLELAIKRAGSAATLAKTSGVAAAYLSQIKNQTPDSKTGTPKEMGDSVARKIETAIGEPLGWMDTDHTPALVVHEVPTADLIDLSLPVISSTFDPIPVRGFRAIPVMGRAQLGDNGHFSEMQMQEGGEGYIDFPSRDPDVYAVKCVGESMKPRIQNGEFAVIEPHHGYDPGDDVLVIAQDERVMIKRFLYKRAGQTHLISVNEAHPPIVLDDVQIKKIHFVRAICRPSVWRETP